MGLKLIYTTGKTHEISTETLLKLFRLVDEDLLMSEEEAKVFNSLPDMVTVYRGTIYNDTQMLRPSWTLDKDKARWFASREVDTYGQDSSALYEITIPSELVVAYFNDRNENEVIVDVEMIDKSEIKVLEIFS